jgi:hypothetical protein
VSRRNATALQELQNQLLWSSTSGGVAAGCDLGFPAGVPPNSSVFILAGDLAENCSAAEVDAVAAQLSSVLRGGIHTFWVGQSPSAPPFVVSAAFRIDDPVLDVYQAFSRYLMRVASVRCSGAISFSPTTVRTMQRTLLTFTGVCDIGQCCVGGVCSSLVQTTGQRVQCFTPILLLNGSFVVSTVGRTGAVSAAALYLTVTSSSLELEAHTW